MDLHGNPLPLYLLTSLFLVFPGISQGFDGYIEIGAANSRSHANIARLSDGIYDSSSFNKDGNATHITLGATVTSHLSGEISYRDFGTTLSDDNRYVEQESVSYDIQLKYRFFNQGRLSLHALLGIAHWHSRLRQEFWIPLYPHFMWGDKTVNRASGFTPKAGLGLNYAVSENLSVGVQYDYYRRLGEVEEIVDRFMLLIGDLPNAFTGRDPLKFSQETYSLNLTYRF